MKQSPLGVNQQGLLDSLFKNGTWIDNGGAAGIAGSGWTWGTFGQTKRLLDGLVKRGLVVVEEKTSGQSKQRIYRCADASQ